ncbi:HflK protein [Microbacterium sp. Nx66]|nr:HflK protein [Microbacterium sp. Nx66]
MVGGAGGNPGYAGEEPGAGGMAGGSPDGPGIRGSLTLLPFVALRLPGRSASVKRPS